MSKMTEILKNIHIKNINNCAASVACMLTAQNQIGLRIRAILSESTPFAIQILQGPRTVKSAPVCIVRGDLRHVTSEVREEMMIIKVYPAVIPGDCTSKAQLDIPVKSLLKTVSPGFYHECIHVCYVRTPKAVIELCGCASGSVSSLFGKRLNHQTFLSTDL